jgi:ABC-type branched-subunit amino acid transport system ATPase component
MLSINRNLLKINKINQVLQKFAISRTFNVLSKRERRLIFAIILIQILLGLLDLVGVMLFGLLAALSVSGLGEAQIGERVATVLSYMKLSDQTLQAQAVVIGLLAAGILTAKTLFSLYFTKRSLYFLARRSAVISSKLIMKLLGQSLLTIQSRSQHQTIYSLTNGVNTVTVNVLGSLITLISDISLLVILTTGLFFVDTLIAISALFIYGIVGLTLYYLMQVKVKKLGKKQSVLLVKSNEKINEVLNSYRELVVRNRRFYYANLIGNIRHQLSDAVAESAFLVNISKYVMEITVVVGGLTIAAIQFSTQTASYAIASLSIFLASSTRIAPAVLRIQQGTLSIKSNIGVAQPTLDLIEQLIGEEDLVKSNDEVNINHPGFINSAELVNVSFAYPNKSEDVIKNLDITIQPGSVTAIVGPSGAGKTTLIDLLIGVLIPKTGKVKISGVSPTDAVQTWPGAIAYVPQDIVITNGTIKENILLGFPENEKNNYFVEESLRIAHLYDFVMGLEQGVDSKVGDRGSKLSGGQRQRLGIARAMFTKPKILILDEATSSLDGESEANISQAILQMKGKTTVILIAHRLSTVRAADNLLYIDGGILKASGSFDEVRQKIPDFDRQAKLMGL